MMDYPPEKGGALILKWGEGGGWEPQFENLTFQKIIFIYFFRV